MMSATMQLKYSVGEQVEIEYGGRFIPGKIISIMKELALVATAYGDHWVRLENVHP